MRIKKLNLKRSHENDQSGWLLIETAISLPIISILLVATCMIFWQGWKFYRSEIADWILQEEICQAMQNMSQQIPQVEGYFDLNGNFKSGLKINSGSNYDRLTIEVGVLKSGSSGVTYKHNTNKISYFVDSNPDGEMQLYSNQSNEPITGMNLIFGKVVITKFRCNLKRTDLLRIELAGRSLQTNHEFSLATEIFLPNMNHE